LRALPGAPLFEGSAEAVLETAMQDVRHYQTEGLDAILIENSFDVPYVKEPLPDEAFELVLRIAKQIRAAWEKPLGIQLLEAANHNLDALRVAAKAGLDFIRVEAFVFAHVGGAGLIQGCAGQLLRERKTLQAGRVAVVADLQKKHCAHALTGDLTIGDHAKQAELFLADGLIVTGSFTGEPPRPHDLLATRAASRLPLWIGSGLTPENWATYQNLADGFIVGSAFREGGRFLAPTDPGRLRAFVNAARGSKG
jgi:hypothetical protein